MNQSLCFATGILLLMTSLAVAQNPIRVACVGDSITYGDQLPDRTTQSYPAVLEQLSKGRLLTGNFGVNGATALNNPGRAWTNTSACRAALSFSPNLVVIMLGINDLAFPAQYDQYSTALREILARFQSLPSSPRLFLCTLTPIAPADRQTEANQTIREFMIPTIRAVATEMNAQLIDIANVFPNRMDFLPDGLHPSPEGAKLIAETVLAAIDAPSLPPPQIRPAPATGAVDISIRNEARAAQNRAQRWLIKQPPPLHLQDPTALLNGRDLRAPEDIADLLPLLDGKSVPTQVEPYVSYVALAHALARIGHETVFLTEDRPVAWRAALLHQLVQRQHIDAQGNGFWTTPETEDPPTDPVRSTAYVLQALATALGE